ncbi:MAG: 50S ribosomal protein L18, partial [Moraxellaceae bacterium]|nr:50S ribosomal protein L18 [Moraxellaceae bacterium]
MNEKKVARLRRARSTRLKIRELGAVRLCVNRTPRHIYAQVIAADGASVLAQASTLDASLRDGATGNADAAKKVGELLAER